jgi:flagellar motility protein MotE (MotC chaperone)
MNLSPKKMPRLLRLLPSVVVVGAGLLVLNASGLIHDAYAGINAPGTDALAPPPAPGNKDFADDQTQIASASEVDVLTNLSKRRGELDAREAQLQVQANILAATEARIDAKLVQLKSLQSQIATLIGQRDAAQEKQLASLVKTYSAMKPKDAARIFDSLNDQVLVPVAAEMKSDVLAPVLAAMSPEQAQKLTVRLANKLTLPDTTEAPLVAAANPAAVGPAAGSAPAGPAPAGQATAPAAPGPATASKTAAPAAPAAKTGG